jgi:hypothetical protein
VRPVRVSELFDELPEAIVPPPATVWSIFVRSLGEQGATGRTALAWRWALTGNSASPITVTPAPGQPPTRDRLLAEAQADAPASRAGLDPGGEIMQARFIIQWLAGDLAALPLWNGGPDNVHVTDGVACPRSPQELYEISSWAALAQWQHPRPSHDAPDRAQLARGQADGTAQLIEWASGIRPQSPLARTTTVGRPSLYQLALDVMHARASLEAARATPEQATAGRMEAIMDAFAWLAGWTEEPPVDRHGHLAIDDCPERGEPCRCDEAGCCLATDCPACRRTRCVHGFGG